MVRKQDTAGKGRVEPGSAAMGSLLVAAVVGIFGFQMVSSSSAPAVEDSDRSEFAIVATTESTTTLAETEASGAVQEEVPPLIEPPQRGDVGATTPSEADGALPYGTTVFDDMYAGVANLDSALLRALRTAAGDAGRDDVSFYVTSGWRSAEHQTQLLHEAVAEYGSEEEAARWVATSETSAHVSGEAVDIGPADAYVWMAEHGAGYGLCQIYANEPWHYELRPQAVDRGCPDMYPDPTHDPRMQP
ncbi:MAG TPA: M15 family metallopeptidase [Wenzhouxiangella sp.]|nr:M15 family metallopeptidase [Wenzhouxiangella sp.]